MFTALFVLNLVYFWKFKHVGTRSIEKTEGKTKYVMAVLDAAIGTRLCVRRRCHATLWRTPLRAPPLPCRLAMVVRASACAGSAMPPGGARSHAHKIRPRGTV